MTAHRPRLVLSVVATAAFFLSVDLTFVNVALPDIGRLFTASAQGLAWVVDAYTVALTSLLIPGAAVAERFGRKAVFLSGMTLFTAASVAAGLASSLPVLLAARGVMGVGAGMMLAPAMAITAMTFAPEARPRALAVWASAGALGLALGPVLGGLVVGWFGWRWAFLAPVPILLAFLVVGIMTLPGGRGPDDVGFDGWGAGLALFSLAPLVAGLIEGPALGWTSRWTLGLLLFGVIMLVSFVIRERSTPNPAFDVEALSRPRVAAAALILSAAYVTFMGVLFLVTIELQDLAGLGPIGYGLVLTPMSVSYWLTWRPPRCHRTHRDVDLVRTGRVCGRVRHSGNRPEHRALDASRSDSDGSGQRPAGTGRGRGGAQRSVRSRTRHLECAFGGGQVRGRRGGRGGHRVSVGVRTPRGSGHHVGLLGGRRSGARVGGGRRATGGPGACHEQTRDRRRGWRCWAVAPRLRPARPSSGSG